ncbi:MAG TPA: APC family permease [Bryobacteraceae bacterium]|nr:APC family permease [Bryobacteraceae bacterium]
MRRSTTKKRDLEGGLVQGLGLLQSIALNMSNMVGVGPFITIPLIIVAMGGPQCMLGWLLGAVLAMCDGLVWSELSAALPGSGGTYVYLREAFRGTRLAGIIPFLFIWQFVLSGPLEIASGYIGFAQYAGYLWRGMGTNGSHLIGVAVGVIAIVLLYRRITAVGRLAVALWVGVLLTVLCVIVSGLLNFHVARVLDFPPGAFRFSFGFAAGLGSATLIAMYDYMGYYDICYVAGEVRNPSWVIPRSIIWSTLGVATLYLVMNASIIAVVPWRVAMNSKYIGAEFMERLYGPRAASALTILILWTAFASVFALLLGYSRIPYAAALDGNFFRPFGRLHPVGRFPHVSVLAMGGLAIVFSFFALDEVISALLSSRILIQFMGQIVALHYLRRRNQAPMPFRMWLYPLPAAFAFLGWMYIFVTSGWRFTAFGISTLATGAVVYLVWTRRGAPTTGSST